MIGDEVQYWENKRIEVRPGADLIEALNEHGRECWEPFFMTIHQYEDDINPMHMHTGYVVYMKRVKEMHLVEQKKEADK